MSDMNKLTAKESVHTGHRARVRQKLLSSASFESLLDHEILEFILFQSIPRGDTNPIAHRLIDKFGSFNRVVEASPKELMQVEGVGEATALHLASYLAVIKRYMQYNTEKKLVFDDTRRIKEYIQSVCMGNKFECAYALYLDKSYRLIKTEKISEGNIDSTGIYIDRIIEDALFYKAFYVVLGHNHTSGNVFPSEQDVINTELLMDGLMKVKKFLLDSVIVDHLGAFSMLENGIITNNRILSPYVSGTDLRIGR